MGNLQPPLSSHSFLPAVTSPINVSHYPPEPLVVLTLHFDYNALLSILVPFYFECQLLVCVSQSSGTNALQRMWREAGLASSHQDTEQIHLEPQRGTPAFQLCQCVSCVCFVHYVYVAKAAQ